MLPCRLEILGYRTLVRLGVPEAERRKPQEVEFDVRFFWKEAPAGVQTDRIEDTICYDEICTAIEKTVNARPYALIEALGRTVYDAIRALTHEPRLEVSIRKIHPPIAKLHGGARFVYGDL